MSLESTIREPGPVGRFLRLKPVRYGFIALVFVLLAAMPFLADDYQLAIFIAILLAVIGAVGTNLLIGVADQASIGNAAFLAIGAFAAALVSSSLHLPLVLTVIVSGGAAALIGLLIAIPAVRVRGLYLIIATLALHYIVLYLFTRFQGSTVGIGGFTLEPIRFPGLTMQQGWFYIAGIAALVAIGVMRNLLRSRFGRAWFAMSRDEVASRALGVNLFRQKLAVFGLSSFLLGLQGGLYAYYVGVVSSDQFTFDMAVSYVAMVVVGGLGTVAGSVLGAIFVVGLPYLVSGVATFLPTQVADLLSTRLFAVQSLLYGVAIIAFIVFEPRGLVFTWRRIVNGVARLFRRREAVAVVENVRDAPAVPVREPRLGDDAVLAVRNLQVTYNRLSVAIDNIDIAVGNREIVVMLGANGAGKTTTLRGISGFLPGENAHVTEGSVLLDGGKANGKLPFELARRGMVLVPERDKVFKTLTVAENMAVVPTRPGGDRVAMVELIDTVFPALKPLRNRQAGFLSGGERQMLAIAKALISDPKVLLVDELSLGIAPFLVTRMMHTLDEIRKAHDISILLVEQNAPAALAIADYAYVLQTGRILLEGTGRELLDNPEVQRLYLGGSEPGRYGRLEDGEGEMTGNALLEVEGVSLKFGNIVALEGVSFEVSPGERLGIIGPNGAGKTSLLNCLNGVVRPQAGRMQLDGVDLVGRPGYQYIRLGVGRTFQGVSLQPGATVIENIMFGSDFKMRNGILESALGIGRARTEGRRSRQRADEILALLGIEHLGNRLAGSLPWGRQKIVEIGRALAAEPKILLLDEPTSGMSHEEKVQVSVILARLQSEIGLTQILIEHDANFVSDLCNRVVVLDYGKVIASGPPADVMKNPLVVAAYLGVPADGAAATNDKSGADADH